MATTAPAPTVAPTAANKAVTAPPKKAARPAPAKTAAKSKNKTPPKAKTKPVPKKDQAPKIKKTKMVRDSFTIPKTEYAVLDELKQRATKLAQPMKKSELIRAGIKALSAMSNDAFLKATAAVPSIKTGRPKSK